MMIHAIYSCIAISGTKETYFLPKDPGRKVWRYKRS